MLTNDYSIVDNMKYAKNTMDSNFSNQFATLEEPSVEYPQLIYDGPFSDSVLNKEIKGLSDVQLTKDQAQAKITQELFGYDTIKYSGQTDGKFVTYNFTLNFSDGTVGFAPSGRPQVGTDLRRSGQFRPGRARVCPDLRNPRDEGDGVCL